MQFDEPAWMVSQPGSHEVFNTLVSFISNAFAEPDDVQYHVESTITTLEALSIQNPTITQYKAQSRMLFAIILAIVKQLDADATQQNNLITLVLSLRELPLPANVAQGIDPGPMGSDMNRSLTQFIHVWSDIEYDAPLHPRFDDRPGLPIVSGERPPWRLEPNRYLSATAWTNLNAFMARLHTSAPDVQRLDTRGLFAMIEALEQPLTPSRLDDVLPAAACWIIYAGQVLKKNDIPYAYFPEDFGSKRMPWSKGELWNGPYAFNRPRWDFWMQKFREISERDNVSGPVREVALRAFNAGSQ